MSAPLPSLPGPLFFLVAALAVAALSYLVHRWSLLSGLVAAAGCLLLAWIAVRLLAAQSPSEPLSLLGRTLALGPSLTILGRTWALTSSSLAALALIYALAGLAFLFALPTPQGWSFYPFGVAVLSVLTLAVTAQQYVYAILFIWLAANLAAFVLAGGRPGETTAAFRFLVFTSLGVMPLLLLPGSQGPDPTGFAPGLVQAVEDTALAANSTQTAVLLMTVGFAILLMMVPFHGHIVAIAAHATPMAPAFMLAVFPTVVLHTLFRLWQAQPALMEERLVFDLCRWLGIAAAALGGLAALGQRRWGSLVGYASLVDWGAGLIALGQGTIEGAALATLMLVWRVCSLLLAGTGWGALYKAAGQRDDIEHCTGMLRRRPLSLLVLLIGLLSLAGLPLTPGAMGREPIYGWLIAQAEPRVAIEAAAVQGTLPFTWPASAITLFLAGVGVCIGALAAVRTCLGAPRVGAHARDMPQGEASEGSEPQEDKVFQDDDGPEREGPPEGGRSPARRRGEDSALEAIVSAGFALLALWLIGALVLHHELWFNVARQLLGGLTFPPS